MEMSLKDKSIAVIGLGLLGTSLAMALKGKCRELTGWSRQEKVLRYVLDNGIVDNAPESPSEAVCNADITVLCLPIPVICDFLRQHAGDFKSGAVVTDIGSVKGIIVRTGEEALTPSGVKFVGSHPMAGTEKTGAFAAFPGLYDHAEVFITPTENTDESALSSVYALWSAVGTAIRVITPDYHDRLVAHTSHISHLLALGITLSVLNEDDPQLRRDRFSGCATGFRDTSRIASSSPSMWREIIEANQQPVLEAIAEFERYFNEIKELIKSGRFDEFEKLFARGKELRDSWIAYKNSEHNCKW